MSNYIYHGTRDLIVLPGRSVQTYPSGLVRVERSFMCRKDDVARYRSILRVNEPMPYDDNAPAIDGLYIFPDPQEQVRDDGFVEFRVTAYGRTSFPNSSKIEKSTVRSNMNVLRVIGGVSTSSIESLNETYTIRGVLGKDESILSVIETPEVSNPFILLTANNTQFIEGIDRRPTSDPELDELTIRTISIKLDSYRSANFGIWNEITIVYIATGSVFITLQ